MARDQDEHRKDKQDQADSPKPGSDPEALKAIGGKGDFGVPAGHVRDRTYTSRNTKQSDPGAAQPMAGTDEDRASGVGGNRSGVGSSSGGDVDTDIVGVGTGGSTVSSSGITGRPPGPDDSDGSSNEFASGPPAQGKNQAPAGQIGGPIDVHGTTVDHSGGDAQTTGSGQGADAATTPQRDDDSFAGEVSSGEAGGQDSQ